LFFADNNAARFVEGCQNAQHKHSSGKVVVAILIPN